ncbi:MAG: DNA mismatch endonuclease Vsr [FCB group bacterium]|jgi:DNA mismatch endonuclease (patch repair protein)|nr:DNA mismatch endonuclease Vsr [FCB group bacterium]
MDKLTPERRSWNMSKIQLADTKPEILVRSLLHRMGYRFRLHRKDLPGRPDIVLPRHNAVILVHGCFWHRHAGCKFAYTPKTRQEFWGEKFKANVRRDATVRQRLTKMGWRILVVWECELNDLSSLKVNLESFLSC